MCSSFTVVDLNSLKGILRQGRATRQKREGWRGARGANNPMGLGSKGARKTFLVTEFQTYKNKEVSSKCGEMYFLTYKERNAELSSKATVIYDARKNGEAR